MSLPLTPAMLEGAYEYLRTTPPFNRWKLPHADDVEFKIGRQPHYGEYCAGETAEHCITVSSVRVGHSVTLLETMAHEMVHLHLAGTPHAKSEHGAEFRRLARKISDIHGFDPKRF